MNWNPFEALKRRKSKIDEAIARDTGTAKPGEKPNFSNVRANSSSTELPTPYAMRRRSK